MDESKAREIVTEHVGWLRWAMQLQRWRINVVYGSLSSEDKESRCAVGFCTSSAEYRDATIEIDHNLIRNETHLLDVLRHEMLHIVHAELNGLFREQIRHAVGDMGFAVLDETRKHVSERIVGRIEAMLTDGLGMTPKRMIATAKRREI